MSPSSWFDADPGSSPQVVWEDGDRVFCRGRRDGADGDHNTVLVVLPCEQPPTRDSLNRLRHEYGLKDDLDDAWAVQPLELVHERGQTMLVLRDPGGEPLDRLLGPPWEVGRFLRLAVALSGALGRLHQRGLVHKDIKPTNIVVNSATDQVWLTGFGIASRLPREQQLPEPPEFIAGTLPYMAPEQTGRMNRSIDSRSDLYSLGITFYEMLTGTLPFAAADPMEWVHCHIARRPVPPDERVAGVPGPLVAIVMKLLTKTAEERYQTAAGLENDLRRCLAEWDATGHIEPFPLGAHDVPDRLLIPEKLYGRQREIDTLLASFGRVVANGAPELVLVSGYPGIGKSSVVNELHKMLVPPRGLFASGKFDQYKRDIPYATLAQAFQGLVRPILGQSETELGRWRDCLREALGPNGQLIVNLVPELELVIGKQPPVPDLSPRDAQNRFQLAVRRFLGAFGRPEHPLALFLDDLQWLDVATLDLLEHLATHPEVRHLLLVVAYRDSEVGPSHPLLWMLEAIRNAKARVQEIVLSPLGLDDVGELVANSLHCEPERAKPLAQLVQEKTGGNPFFAIQFFTALADEGLLAFEPTVLAWQWNMDRIRAKNYTHNVVDLMAGKLKRLSSKTQEALKQLACLGNVVPTATLAMGYGATEEAIHAALWEAVQAGLVFHHETTWKFLHDRIQQAAYSLISNEQRADVHLRIGRALLAGMTVDQLTENLFDVANQLNRGATRLIDRDEKAQVATIDLRAGRKAKASAAYASACAHLAAGMALLHESDWDSRYDLMFSLRLENAECEFLSGNFENAERLIGKLLERGASKVDQAAVYHLKVQYHVAKSENPQAVDSALTCLRLFGIDLPAHPTLEQVQAEYEAAWQSLDGRPIESLIDLPLMSDPELQAVMQVLAVLGPPAFLTDFRLFCLQVCRMVSIGMQHGASGAAAHAYGYLGIALAAVYHRHRDAYGFAKLACDLVEKHGFIAYRSKVYSAMAAVAFWTQPIANVIDFMRAGIRTAIETGDLYFACYGMHGHVTCLLLRNDPLDIVWRESEMALDLIREANYGDTSHVIISQQRFIATMRGRTATFSSFSDTRFDEATFEAQLTADCMSLTIAWYWILKLKARFLSGDYAEALAAADKAKPLLSTTFVLIELLDYHYYTALAASALYENASADEQQKWRDLLTEHREQLREWTENYPPTFADKYQLVLAEIARLEGRDADAMRLYEQAIQSAREHGFVQNEGVGHELAAGFYLGRGSATAARAHLENARGCFTRWGAIGKVQQLDRRYPRPRERTVAPLRTGTIDTLIEKLDVASVVKASQAVSGEIELSKLIETLLRIAIEHAGAERGLLILFRGDEARIAAEAKTGRGRVEVTLRKTAVSPAELPEPVLQCVIRTREIVILDDALAPNMFSADEYIRQKRVRSVLCLPLVKQARLIGVLYLENNLASHVFTPARISVLELLASQAAVSLENARLYNDLQEREAKVRRLVDSNIIGIVISDFEGRILEANEAFLDIIGYSREDLVLGRLRWTDLTPSEWRDADDQALAELRLTRKAQPCEKEYIRKDGSRVTVLIGSTMLDDREHEGVSFVLDLTERKQTEKALRQSESYLSEAQRLSSTGSWAWVPARDEIRYWSEECFRIVGFDPAKEPPPMETIFERIHPDDRAKAAEVMERAPHDKADFTLDYRVIHPGGRVRDLHLVGHPVFSASGDLAEFVGTVIDVTERKQAEEQRQAHVWFLESMDKVNRAIQGTNDPEQMTRDVLGAVLSIFACDRAWLIYPCDPEAPSWRVAMEYTRPEYPGAFALGIDLPVDSEAVNVFQTARTSSGAVQFGPESDRPVPTQMAERFGIQSLIAIAIHPKVDKPYLFGLHQCSYPRTWTAREGRLFQEVGRRLGDGLTGLLMLRNLRESEGKLEEAQRIAHVGHWDHDLDTDSFTWSDETYRIFDVPLQEKGNTSAVLKAVIHPEDWESNTSASISALRGDAPYNVEYRVVRSNGEVRFVHSRGDVTIDETGRPRRMFGIVQDVTERKQSEENLRESERRNRETQAELAHVSRLSVLGELTASIAHEVNQPLTGVAMYGGACLLLLDDEVPRIDQARGVVEQMIGSARHASEVIARIRALSRKGVSERVRFDMNQAIDDVIALILREINAHGVALRLDLGASLPPVDGDRVQLQQVMMNLLMNGIQAMNRVTGSRRELLIRSREHGADQILVTVEDSGIGIEPEHVGRLFDAFFTTKPNGMGMGLAICRSIVEQHGGCIWATRNFGAGSTFQFTLPVYRETAS
jgi:PAS domain S-box-containing protein